MSRDFRKLLFEVSEALVTDELSALKFLTWEHVPRRKLEAIQEPKAFFEALQEKDMIGVGNLSFLKELLYRIGRIDLLTAHLGSRREEMERELQLPGRAQVSAYRQLLYGIAEDLTPEDVRSVKFLLQKQLPKNKLQENASMLQVFLEMEINGIIKEDNLTMLKDILQGFRPDLKKKIDAYEEKRKESCMQINALRRSFIMLVFCIPGASTHTVKFSGEETVSVEVNGPAFCTVVQKWVFSFTYISQSGDAGEWLAWDDYSHSTFYYLYLTTSTRAEKQWSAALHGFYNNQYSVKLEPCLAQLYKMLVSHWENYSREEVRYPVSVSAHPEEQKAEREARHPYGKIYKMKNNPHGYCLILNNHIFKNPRYNREGTLQDGEAVKRVFKWLQFETVEYMDLEGKKIKDTVKEYSKKDHRNMDCFVCFILSHGEKDKIKGVDDVCVNIEDLISCFTGTNCPSLAGKPKVFIIQACQGSLGHPSVTVEPDSSGHLQVDATPLTSIPDKADILIGMATVEDYLSFRSRRTGSVYIQSLCEKMKLLCPLGVDFAAILTEVNNEVAGRELEGCKQMPKITSTLLKQLIFEIPQ